ncbi:hypothetical protein EXIGLDRAFT_768299 [Exidia glandulosa HHB12029]|uniref:Prolyl 4-hydroxylase alpha subunit Fe(2+) 2OG dioxygenase domain-containing protein n=1 Tax=Exidia glandulosa HHB12029 TaxID=1314781 RepID=A0A165IBR6_EXIGL|nr:hypothetical protein EXIGLDRAFT_768299 [Exidia glandulosa HHB12029]
MCLTLGQDIKEVLGDDFQLPYPDVPFFIDTANTGKQVVTQMHVDFKNTLFGMCVIAVFGKFNHKKHSMLVLKELKFLVQLKHGDIIFIPSALATHGNTVLTPTDIHRSWTMFNSGVLFRYCDTGFCTFESLAPEDAHNMEKMYPVFFWDYMSSHLTLQELKSYHCVA